MVRVLPELQSLSFLLLAQKLQLKEKLISPKVWVFFFNVVPGSVEFFALLHLLLSHSSISSTETVSL